MAARLSLGQILPALVLTVAVTLAFFVEGLHADFSSLGGDQVNILSICAKKDYPQLFHDDQLVGDPGNVSYYIPVFVGLVRLSSLPDHNYLRGLNILLLVTGLLYTAGWWRLFVEWTDPWSAGVLAFLARGIMWPPGRELWGIAGLWSMLPRTLFLALLPWVVWAWIQRRNSARRWRLVSLCCGLLVNVHPLSGIYLAVSLLAADFAWTAMEAGRLRAAAVRLLAGAALVLAGAAPCLWIYLVRLKAGGQIDPRVLDEALKMRISAVFLDPSLYWRQWLTLKWAALVVLPWIGYWILRRELAAYRLLALSQGVFLLSCVLLSVIPALVVAYARSRGHHLPFGFELVRGGKYILVPTIVVGSLVLGAITRTVRNRAQSGQILVAVASCLVVALTLVCREPVFDNVPALGNDVFRWLWPLPRRTYELVRARSQPPVPLLQWIRENTSENARFVGPRLIRVGALRPVIHDMGGAVMLIEGNPRQFVESVNKERESRRPEYRDPLKKGALLAGWGADYWVTRTEASHLQSVYSEGGWHVYDLRAFR